VLSSESLSDSDPFVDEPTSAAPVAAVAAPAATAAKPAKKGRVSLLAPPPNDPAGKVAASAADEDSEPAELNEDWLEAF
jgi:hypothetical protein